MNIPTKNYEAIHAKISSLQCPTEIGRREIHWITEKKFGVAITSLGNYELFFANERIRANSKLIRRSLQFSDWHTSTGSTFEASRIAFPLGNEFLAISALIAVECIRSGLEDPNTSLQKVFSNIEPILELAIKRTFLSQERILGLLGELIVLERMLDNEQHSSSRADVLEMWQGHSSASRDFLVGNAAVEVKTTTLTTSTHCISSLDQITLNGVRSDISEDKLYLLSIGLTPVNFGHFSISNQVNQILNLLGEKITTPAVLNASQQRFLNQLKKYGGNTSGVYDHLRMKDQAPYTQTYATTFVPRLFSLTDQTLNLLSADILRESYVNPERIKFQLDLPSKLNLYNPTQDWASKIQHLVTAAIYDK